MEIRYILPTDDRMAISRVYEESWKYAYKGILPQGYLDSIPEGRWAPIFGPLRLEYFGVRGKWRDCGDKQLLQIPYGKIGWLG